MPIRSAAIAQAAAYSPTSRAFGNPRALVFLQLFLGSLQCIQIRMEKPALAKWCGGCHVRLVETNFRGSDSSSWIRVERQIPLSFMAQQVRGRQSGFRASCARSDMARPWRVGTGVGARCYPGHAGVVFLRILRFVDLCVMILLQMPCLGIASISADLILRFSK